MNLWIILIALVDSPHGTPGDHLVVVGALADACRSEWPEEPDCLPAVVAIARWESGLRAAPGSRWGCGVGQVQPLMRFSLRGVGLQTLACRDLEDLAAGAIWTVRVLQAKADRVGASWVRRFAAYNGTPQQRSYARRVLRTFAALRHARDAWVERAVRVAGGSALCCVAHFFA